ncbi:MAG TPA: alpha/beta hydrolase [Casimicrobiaceae bacterium]|nr:alpha/beta hydrolase [Casimicrobiaceae bacterium]
MPAFARDGVEIYYEVKGSGRPLMLVAGLAADSAFWAPSLDALSTRYRLILPDNRGSGRTTPLDVASTLRDTADDCMALAAHLGIAKVSLAGHSMGGMIVQDCAARYPDAVDRIMLASTTPCASARDNDLFSTWAALFAAVDRRLWFRNLFYWVLSPAFFTEGGRVDALVTLAASYPYQQTAAALANQVKAIAGFDARASLSSIRARALVMAGTLDLLFPIAEAAAFAKSIPHASFAPIDGAAHSFPIEAPMEFTQRVLDFLG